MGGATDVKKTVQELAGEGGEPPEWFLRQVEEASPLQSPVPTIDLAALFSSGDPKRNEMEKLRFSLQSWGFFQAVGHGMSVNFLDVIRGVAADFFDLPLQEKEIYGITENDDDPALEGYGTDKIEFDDQILNWSDRLYLLVIPEDQRKLKFWPNNPSIFREVIHEYILKIEEIAGQILRVIAEMLGLEENYFCDRFGSRAPMYARFNYYPPCSRPTMVLGIKPHSDAGGLTVLLPDKQVEGLQALKDKKWVPIPIIPQALLINLGDQMEIMSNGIFKSQVHRVVTNSHKERISLAVFYSPAYEQEIEPAQALVDNTRPQLYRRVEVKEYISIFYKEYIQGKRAIHKVGISQECDRCLRYVHFSGPMQWNVNL